MMKVVGEEGTSIEDFIVHMKAEFFDAVYLQQNAFDPVDAATPANRQRYVFDVILEVMKTDLELADKDAARTFFNGLRQKCLDWNSMEWESDDFKNAESEIKKTLEGTRKNA